MPSIFSVRMLGTGNEAAPSRTEGEQPTRSAPSSGAGSYDPNNRVQILGFAVPGWHHRADEPLLLATLAEPCGVRALAGRLLDAAAVPWREVFVGGGVAVVSAAVMAGLGVAALASRMLPF